MPEVSYYSCLENPTVVKGLVARSSYPMFLQEKSLGQRFQAAERQTVKPLFQVEWEASWPHLNLQGDPE